MMAEIIGDLSIVLAELFKRGAGKFVTPSEFHEAIHGQLIFTLNVLENDEAALLVLDE